MESRRRTGPDYTVGMSDAAVIVCSTLPAGLDPGPIARALVEERLAACVQVLPAMQSVYRWEGAVETADERALLIKTTSRRVSALETRLRSLHPYEVPEFLVLRAEGGSAAYLRWLDDAVG